MSLYSRTLVRLLRSTGSSGLSEGEGGGGGGGFFAGVFLFLPFIFGRGLGQCLGQVMVLVRKSRSDTACLLGISECTSVQVDFLEKLICLRFASFHDFFSKTKINLFISYLFIYWNRDGSRSLFSNRSLDIDYI